MPYLPFLYEQSIITRHTSCCYGVDAATQRILRVGLHHISRDARHKRENTCYNLIIKERTAFDGHP